MWLGVAWCLLVAGCGSSSVKVTGKLTKRGTALSVTEKGRILVSFHPEDTADTKGPYPADVNQSDGTFEVKGKDGGGIPPGKYRVSVQQFDPYPGTDLLKGRFEGRNTKIVVDVKGGDVGEIDVEKFKG